ncbi:MAG: tRNA adenosine(34) deaminase TadA [Clostridia bacterium]|nr:tRNA adenosine(34) deaminase TadA [Clostridia bacterium]
MDEKFMKQAIKQAQKAAEMGEVPIGAVLVKDGKVIARGYNKREKNMSAEAHAELIAIRKACKKENNWRLSGTTLYVTLEPCPMCAGAIINARIDRVVFGAPNPQSGVCGTHLNLLNMNLLNHTTEVTSGVEETACTGLMQEFFKKIRQRNKNK